MTAMYEHVAEIDRDDEGYWWVSCVCGWRDGPFRGREDATHAYGDHREAALSAPPPTTEQVSRQSLADALDDLVERFMEDEEVDGDVAWGLVARWALHRWDKTVHG